MRIQKGRCVATIKTPLFQVLSAKVRLRGFDHTIPFIPANEIDRLLTQTASDATRSAPSSAGNAPTLTGNQQASISS